MPAAIVARELDIRLIESVCVKSYDHQTQGELQRAQAVSAEIVASATARQGRADRRRPRRHRRDRAVVREMLPKAHFATVYAKPKGRPMVDTFITEVSQDTWIFFPWDTGLAFRPPIRPEGV